VCVHLFACFPHGCVYLLGTGGSLREGVCFRVADLVKDVHQSNQRIFHGRHVHSARQVGSVSRSLCFPKASATSALANDNSVHASELEFTPEAGMTVLDEVKEIIELSNGTKSCQVDPETVQLSPAGAATTASTHTSTRRMPRNRSSSSWLGWSRPTTTSTSKTTCR